MTMVKLMKKEKTKKSIEISVDPSRREFVCKTVKASAFAVPLALGIETITARKAFAQAESSEEGSGQQSSSESSEAASVPEPAAVTLLGLGLASLAIQARRRQKIKSGEK